MTLEPYHHGHNAVEEIPWSRLGHILIAMTKRIQAEFQPDIVVGVAKGGVIPAVYLSSAFLVDFIPIKLSSRKNEQVVHEMPVWHVKPTASLKGKKVLIVDDIAVAGRTLEMAAAAVKECGASEVKTATIAIHKGSVSPDFYELCTDALIVWPWDRDTIDSSGTWRINGEYLEEMENIEGYDPGPSPGYEPISWWSKGAKDKR